MYKLKELLMLSEKGYKDLKKAIFACTLTNLSLMLPFAISIQIFSEILKPFLGDQISWTKMWILFGAGIIAAFIVFLCNRYDYEKTYVASYMESENTRLSVSEHIRRLPMNFFNNRDLSELTTNMMADCATSEHVLSHVVPQMISNGISIFIVCMLLSVFDWRMSLAIFCTVPISLLILLGSKKLQKHLSETHVSAKLTASDQIQEYLEGIKVIKAFGKEGDNFSALDNALKAMKSAAMRMELITGCLVSGAGIILQSGIGLTIFLGVALLSGGSINVLTFLTFVLLVVRIYGPILVEFTLLAEIMYMQIVTKRMRTLLGTPVMDGGATSGITNYDIEFKNVTFKYNKDDVIKNLSFKIPGNGITALVGPSGCGKSTISRLIARFWDVGSGSITIGGRNVKIFDPEHLMQYMSFVFQDVVLFNDTVLNNIKIGKQDATEKEVIAAAKAAMCDEFISAMPDGYGTLIGENGCTLSGGERQRISIARALLKNAPIVLLDEATASLDPENEVCVQNAISELIAGKTVIVIAHRLRTIVSADKIVVLQDGQLVEEGKHDDLLQNQGLYARLFGIQQESLGWKI